MYIGGFKIEIFPRYSGAAAADAGESNILAQTAFWETIHILIVNERSTPVELRIVADENDRSVNYFVLLLGDERDNAVIDLCSFVFELLPKSYIWKRLSDAELLSMAEISVHGGGWRVARIHRRCQYVDIPSIQNKGAVSQGPGSGIQSSPRQSFDSPFKSAQRHIPQRLEEFLFLSETKRYCLPVLGQMEALPLDRRSFYESLQTSAPVVVSILLNPFPNAELETDRQLATRFRALVDLIGSSLDNSGFAQSQSLRRVFDRYFLTQKHIALLGLRVAARTDREAIAVAHQFCAWLGGMTAFTIVAPTRDVVDVSRTLANSHLEFPVSDGSHGWDRPLRTLSNTLRMENVVEVSDAEDERYNRFLIRLPHAYTLEEVGQLFRLPYGDDAGLPGMQTRLLPPFFPPSQQYDPIMDIDRIRPANDTHKDRVRLGRVNPSSAVSADPAKNDGFHWHSIPLYDLCKHALIVGSTGSGKTVTTTFLMRELIRLGIPMLIIEPVKTEYYDNLKSIPELATRGKLKRYRFEGTSDGKRSADFLVFDPMRLMVGVSVARHVSYLKSCFEAAFPMDPVQALLLENALLSYYTGEKEDGGCKLRLFTRGVQNTTEVREGSVYPSFATFKKYFLGFFLEKEFGRADPSKSGVRSSGSQDTIEIWRQLFTRRFDNLSKGPLGQAFQSADLQMIQHKKGAPFKYLLDAPTIIELDAIPDADQKSLAMAFLLTFLYEYRQSVDLLNREEKGQGDSSIKHVLVIEEAHRLLANPSVNRRGESSGVDSKTKSVSLFVDMLAEIRAFGQGIIIVEQIPTKLVPEAVKNTNLKIMLRITSRDDRDYLGEAMNFNEDQKKFITTLRVEKGKQVQYVAFDENVEQPILLSLPLPSGDMRLFDEFFIEAGDG